MEIVLVHPEIPPNTGSIARLAAATGVRLHLVEPLGFSLESRYLKRAGLDYWPDVEMQVHADWSSLLASLAPDSTRPVAERLRLFTARGGHSLFESKFTRDDVFVFGCESKGLPKELLDAHPDQHLYVPVRSCVRSLNLSNVVGVGVYTALSKLDDLMPSNDGHYDGPS
jgi:tRNA (cytidine/uridine-2'-O-)-methyltransferase